MVEGIFVEGIKTDAKPRSYQMSDVKTLDFRRQTIVFFVKILTKTQKRLELQQSLDFLPKYTLPQKRLVSNFLISPLPIQNRQVVSLDELHDFLSVLLIVAVTEFLQARSPSAIIVADAE
jgi:hypothetical protein